MKQSPHKTVYFLAPAKAYVSSWTWLKRLRSLFFHINMHYIKMDMKVLPTPGSLCYGYHLTKIASTNRQCNLTLSMLKISFNHFSLSQAILDDISHKGCLRLEGFLQAMQKKLICSMKKHCFVNIFKQLLSQKAFTSICFWAETGNYQAVRNVSYSAL